MKISSRDAHPLLKKISDTKMCFFYFGCFCRKICHADLDSREQQAILLKKSGKNQAPTKIKMRFFCFSGENFGTILSRRSRLSRTSRAPSRLIRPRPIDCDREPKQTVKIFPVLGGRNRQKKVFSKGPPSSGDLHPKRSP